MPRLRTLAKIIFSGGYNSSSSKTDVGNFMADGSSNVLPTGTGKNEIFKGVTVKSTVVGTKTMMNVGDTYCGLGKFDETGIGSIFRVLGAVFFIGAGRFYYTGLDTSAPASPTLSLKKVTSGSLGTTYQAGLAQPSSPTIFAVPAPSGLTGKNSGDVSVKIARVRSATGARSIASLTSNILTTSDQSVAITFPLADSNGQDYWEVDVTKNGEGGIGNHYYLTEIAESTLTATVTASATTDEATTIGVPNGTLTSSNIGWVYTSSGDTTTYVTGVGANDSHSAGKQEITLAAASVLTTTQSATFTRAVKGVPRTYTVEWRDADLVDADLAPYRDYPPPAGIFGGAIGDVVFVDGALGDTVDVANIRDPSSDPDTWANTTITTPGNVIAVSDPAKPESFPPDNWLFTGEPPTAVIEGGDGLYWRFAANSLGVIRYVGGSPALSYEKLWTGIGVRNQNNVTLGAGGRLYAFTGQRGLVRLGAGGEPDTAFAAPVMDDLAAFTPANVVLGYDANNGFVLVAHGTTILAYYEAGGVWSAPLTVSGLGSKAIRSMVTINGAAYLSFTDSSEGKIYDFNVGSGTTAVVTTPWIPSAGEFDIVSRVKGVVRTDNANDVTVKVYINGSGTASSNQTAPVAASGFQQLTTLRPNVRSARMHRVEMTYASSGGSAGFESVETQGETSGVTQ